MQNRDESVASRNRDLLDLIKDAKSDCHWYAYMLLKALECFDDPQGEIKKFARHTRYLFVLFNDISDKHPALREAPKFLGNLKNEPENLFVFISITLQRCCLLVGKKLSFDYQDMLRMSIFIEEAIRTSPLNELASAVGRYCRCYFLLCSLKECDPKLIAQRAQQHLTQPSVLHILHVSITNKNIIATHEFDEACHRVSDYIYSYGTSNVFTEVLNEIKAGNYAIAYEKLEAEYVSFREDFTQKLDNLPYRKTLSLS